MPVLTRAPVTNFFVALLVAATIIYSNDLTLAYSHGSFTEKIQFYPPFSLFFDNDGDGLKNAKDSHPTIHDFPATAYARGKGLPQDVVDLLAPLNTGPDGVPQLDFKEELFIDRLGLNDQGVQMMLTKLAQDGVIEEKETDYVYKISKLNPEVAKQLAPITNKGYITDNDLVIPDYLSSLDPVLANKFISAFSTEISTGSISQEAADQMKFLKGLSADKQLELIEKGLATNYDLDSDGMPNWKEQRLAEEYGLDISPEKYNGRYFIYMNTGPIESDQTSEILGCGKYANRLADLLAEENGIPRENIKLFLGENATRQNLIGEISRLETEADEDSIIYLFIQGHGNYGAFNSRGGGFTYEELDKWLDKLNTKAIIFEPNTCYASTSLEPMKQGQGFRVIIDDYSLSKSKEEAENEKMGIINFLVENKLPLPGSVIWSIYPVQLIPEEEKFIPQHIFYVLLLAHESDNGARYYDYPFFPEEIDLNRDGFIAYHEIYRHVGDRNRDGFMDGKESNELGLGGVIA